MRWREHLIGGRLQLQLCVRLGSERHSGGGIKLVGKPEYWIAGRIDENDSAEKHE